MLTICIGFIAFVVIYASIANGEWGPAAVAGVILLFLWFASSIERRDNKAWNNRQNWWAYGEEPDWKRKQRTARVWTYVPAGKRDTVRTQEEIAAEKRAAYEQGLRDGSMLRSNPDVPWRPSVVVKVCHTCGRMVRVQCELVWTSEGEMLRFLCPRCRCVNMTKAGM